MLIQLVKIADILNPTDAVIKIITLENFRVHFVTMQIMQGEHM